MVEGEGIKPVELEELQLRQGSHAYLLKDELLSRTRERKGTGSLEEIRSQMDDEAIFIGNVRQRIEAMGGKFNGVRVLDVNIPDPEWMDSAFPHRLTFVFADFS